MKKTKQVIESYSAKEAFEKLKLVDNEEVKKDLISYYDLVLKLSETASKNTHYHDLNIWSDQVHDYIRKMLKKHGFVNGNVEANAKNPEVTFWWAVLGILSSIHYSPYLKTQVAPHHSSAWERNEAMIAELKSLIDKLQIHEGK